MFESKYSNFLTVLLVIIIVVIVGLIGFLGYKIYREYSVSQDAQDAATQFEEELQVSTGNTNIAEQIVTNEVTNQMENPFANQQTTVENNTNNSNNSNSSDSAEESDGKTYKGFPMIGTIEIPKTNIKYPILDTLNIKALETSVCKIYGENELNQPGNVVIAGHNYRNSLFFSNNNKLNEGDIIYITDLHGNKVTYTIYEKYLTTPEDAEYMTRDTAGAAEISLTTCTDDSSGRIIILAK